MKYILYARKSTEDREDRQILSIDSQIDEIKQKFPELRIVKVIKESKSAYKAYNRPQFQEMMEIFQSEKAQGLIAWHPDRLSREPISGGMIMHLLDQGLIKDLKFASYNFDNSPEGKMMLGLSLSQSKYFSEKLSVDVKRGMIKKCKQGAMPTKPPIGYIPDRMAEKGEKKHLIDPERYDLVRKMWDLMLTGQYSILQIIKEANKWGLTTRPTKNKPANPLSKTTAYKIFSNPFYTGKFEWGNRVYQGSHQPMITNEEFEKVQIMIKRKFVPRPQIYESISSGLIKCPCGASVVIDHKRKLNKTKNLYTIYKYARCSRKKKGTTCKEQTITLKQLEVQFIEYLKKIQISDSFHKWAIKNLNQFKDKEQKQNISAIKALKKAHSDTHKRADNLLNLKISPQNSDGELLSDDEYKKRKTIIIKERDRITELLTQTDIKAEKSHNILVEAFDMAYHAQERFNKGDIKTKKLILSKIGANFILQNGILSMEAKRPYITFIKHLPEIRKVEELGELDKSRIGKTKKATQEQLVSLWSGQRGSNPYHQLGRLR